MPSSACCWLRKIATTSGGGGGGIQGRHGQLQVGWAAGREAPQAFGGVSFDLRGSWRSSKQAAGTRLHRSPPTPAPTAPPARLLELPPPEVDALGRPTWPITPAQVSKAYRRLSILVHPDKNPSEAARTAFEALNEAHRALKDPSRLVRG